MRNCDILTYQKPPTLPVTIFCRSLPEKVCFGDIIYCNKVLDVVFYFVNWKSYVLEIKRKISPKLPKITKKVVSKSDQHI